MFLSSFKFIIAVFCALMLQSVSAYAYDYCQQSDKKSIFFIDMTTPFDRIDTNRLAMAIDQIIEEQNAGETLIVRTIDETARASKIIFNECMPKCANQGALETCNSTRARLERSKYNIKLGNALKSLKEEQYQRNFSPIMMTLAEHVKKQDNIRHIYIFSDMIENSDILGYTRKNYIPKLQKAMDRLMSFNAYPDLQNTNIDVFGFGQFHDEAKTSLGTFFQLELKKTWESYFKRAGATQINIAQEL